MGARTKGSPYPSLSSLCLSLSLPRVSLAPRQAGPSVTNSVLGSKMAADKSSWDVVILNCDSAIRRERCFVDDGTNCDTTVRATPSSNFSALFLPVIARSFVRPRERSDTHDRGGGYGLPGKLRTISAVCNQ